MREAAPAVQTMAPAFALASLLYLVAEELLLRGTTLKIPNDHDRVLRRLYRARQTLPDKTAPNGSYPPDASQKRTIRKRPQ
jgi:hypothetical protein